MDQPEIACPLDVSERYYFGYHPLDIGPESYLDKIETWLNQMEGICHRCTSCFSVSLLSKTTRRLKFIGKNYYEELGNRVAGLLLRIDRLQERPIQGE